MKLRHLAALAIAASATSIALAQAVPPEKAFGARESITSASLSPDGKTMAFLAPAKSGRGNALFVVALDGSGAPKQVLSASGKPEEVQSCAWVANDRLVCTVVAKFEQPYVYAGTSRLFAVDTDGKNIKLVSERNRERALYFNPYGGTIVDWLPGQDGAVLVGKWHVPEETTGTLIRKQKEGFGVERIDTRTLASRTVVKPIIDGTEFISDGSGNVRISGTTPITGNSWTGIVKYRYKLKETDTWADLSSLDTRTDQGFNPYIVDPIDNVAYGLEKENGRKALFKRTLDGSNVSTRVFARPDVDVDGPVLLGRKRRVVGATFATEKRESVYFDPALTRLATSLSKALPGAPLINFEGASDDEKKLLIWAGSDTDPGRYFLLDRDTKQMRPLLLSRPELDQYKLAPVKAVQVKAADGASVPAYLTLPPGSSGKNLPAIVMPHGGPSARDEWGFDWLSQYFAHKGFAVLQPNYRGSSGYGDQWFQNNGFKSWRVAIGDVTDSGRWLVSQGVADPSKLAIVGWSYGGYAALQSGVVAPDLFKAIVAIAPVTDLDELKRQYAQTGYQRVIRDFVGVGPHTREGSPAQNAGAIKAPVLMFHGDLDVNVRIVESRLMEDKLKAAGKKVTLVTYPNLAHSLNASEARADMLGKSDAFLRASMGMK